MKLKDYPKYAPVIIFATLIVLSMIIIAPFISSLLIAGVLAYVFYPWYKIVDNKIGKKNLSAFLVSMLIIIAVAFTFIFISSSMTKEIFTLYNDGLEFSKTSFNCQESSKSSLAICKITNYMRDSTNKAMFDMYFSEAIKKTSSLFLAKISSFIVGIPKLLLNFFIIFFVMFFLLRDSEILREKIKVLIPMKKSHQEKIFKKVNDTIYAIIYGNLIVALIQGVTATIGYYLFGVQNPILWGFLTIIFAFIPYVGAIVVWLPVVLLKILNGVMTASNNEVLSGLFLAVYSFFLVSTLDNILKPKIIGDRGNIHPVVVLIGVLGGLSVMGFIGIIIGPLVLSLLFTFFEIYQEERGLLKKGKLAK